MAVNTNKKKEANNKPSIGEFRKILRELGGNLSKVAEYFGVYRGTVYKWRDEDPAFMAAIRDERTRLLDEVLTTSRVVALGVPKMDYEYDENGEPIYDNMGRPIRKMVGWAVPPDANMLRYFMNIYGRYDKIGFTEEDGATIPQVKEGINIHNWIELRNEGVGQNKKKV